MIDSRHIDPERLAALLDGRLGAAEAAAVREQLALSDDDTLSAFADAAAIHSELDAESGSAHMTGVIPIDRAARRRRAWPVVALGSALVAAAAIGIVVFSTRDGAPSYQASVFATAIHGTGISIDAPQWGIARGASDGVSDRARAIRIGALLTDVEVLARQGGEARERVQMLAALLDAVPGARSVTVQLGDLVAAGTPIPPSRISEIGAQAAALVDGTLVTAGAYLEAARLATGAGDAGFFDRAPLPAFDGLAAGATPDDSTTLQLGALRKLVGAQPRDAGAINAAVSQLLRAVAR